MRLKRIFLRRLIITANPRIIVKLATFEPRTLPIAKLPWLIKAAFNATTNSGREVDKDNKMNPADISLIPKTFDNFIT